MWPSMVHLNEIQSRMLHDGLPVERTMVAVSELRLLQHGGRYRIERAQGDLYLYSQGNGYFAVADE